MVSSQAQQLPRTPEGRRAVGRPAEGCTLQEPGWCIYFSPRKVSAKVHSQKQKQHRQRNGEGSCVGQSDSQQKPWAVATGKECTEDKKTGLEE